MRRTRKQRGGFISKSRQKVLGHRWGNCDDYKEGTDEFYECNLNKDRTRWNSYFGNVNAIYDDDERRISFVKKQKSVKKAQYDKFILQRQKERQLKRLNAFQTHKYETTPIDDTKYTLKVFNRKQSRKANKERRKETLRLAESSK